MSNLEVVKWGAYHDEIYTTEDGEFIAACASPELCAHIVDLHNNQGAADGPDKTL